MDLKRTPVVGDFFYTSWGYDQTNVDFYKVVGLTPSGKSVRLQRWTKANVAPAGDMHDSFVPHTAPAEHTTWKEDRPANFANLDWWEQQAYKSTGPAPVFTARLIDGHVTAQGQYAWLWDGKPKYQTGHGYGH